MAFQLNPGTFGNSIDFTGIHNGGLALDFALRGWTTDERSREDAIVIEVPYSIAAQRVLLDQNCDKYFFPPDLFKDVRLKIYRPIRD